MILKWLITSLQALGIPKNTAGSFFSVLVTYLQDGDRGRIEEPGVFAHEVFK